MQGTLGALRYKSSVSAESCASTSGVDTSASDSTRICELSQRASESVSESILSTPYIIYTDRQCAQVLRQSGLSPTCPIMH